MSALPEVIRATVPDVPNVVLTRYPGMAWEDALCEYDEEEVTDRRPLVLIDPEDAEQVAALCEAFANGGTGSSARWDSPRRTDDNKQRITDGMRRALRSLAQPTPPEPQGLGAVVRDRQGRVWINCPDATSGGIWNHRGDVGLWRDLAQPVTVLAEGWSE